MRVATFVLLFTVFAAPAISTPVPPRCPDALNFTLRDISRRDVQLCQYTGKVVLLVNTATKDGFTKQLVAMQEFHARYADSGLVVIAQPSNDFLYSEPGTDSEILTYMQRTFGFTAAVMSKAVVKGDGMLPIYSYLTTNVEPKGPIIWTFTKFLIDRKGRVQRFGPRVKLTDPELANAIAAALADR